ncbi:MAG: DUF5668 domain-containing protein [Anaerolineaceae bacterium]|nr:DUF5668 domain-containing protein [Anaerolineaceae bacterium]
MDIQYRRRRSLIFPLLLITAGIVLLLSNTGTLSGNLWEEIGRFWPALLIIFGLDDIYRGGSLVGPVFWVGLGVIFLLINLNYLQADIWDLLFRFWPVIIILAGVEIIFGRFFRKGWGVLAGLLLIFIVLGGIFWYAGSTVSVGKVLTTQNVQAPLNGATSAVITISPAAAKTTIRASQNSSNLVEGSIKTSKSENVREDQSVQNGIAIYSLKSQGMTVITPFGDHSSGDWDLSLHPNIPTDLTFNIGVGEAILDLQHLSITSLRVNGAVGRVTVVLPQQGNYSAQVNGAIGEIVLIVPEGLPARITVNNAIAGLRVQGNLVQNGKLITTPGFQEGKSHTEVQLSIAIGGVVVRSD